MPYLLAGRADLPFNDVFGLDRKDDLVFVANGNGGVQLFDISDVSAPYNVAFIKPNGFARDVKVSGNYAYIAASNEGVVAVDIANPNLPVIDVLDTLGIANRLKIVGDRLYVSNMSGLGRTSQLNVIDISDPFDLRMEKSLSLIHI